MTGSSGRAIASSLHFSDARACARSRSRADCALARDSVGARVAALQPAAAAPADRRVATDAFAQLGFVVVHKQASRSGNHSAAFTRACDHRGPHRRQLEAAHVVTSILTPQNVQADSRRRDHAAQLVIEDRAMHHLIPQLGSRLRRFRVAIDAQWQSRSIQEFCACGVVAATNVTLCCTLDRARSREMHESAANGMYTTSRVPARRISGSTRATRSNRWIERQRRARAGLPRSMENGLSGLKHSQSASGVRAIASESVLAEMNTPEDQHHVPVRCVG